MRVTVVIPALNEAESLPAVLRDIPHDVDQVVVVDNGSTDGTAAVAREHGADVVSEPRRGYGTAVLAGVAHLQAEPPEVLVVLDADHADPPDAIPVLVAPIVRDEADLVQSDRTAMAEPGALTLLQRLGNVLATQLIAWTSGHRYRDMGPFRAIRWSSLMLLHMEDPTWGWNVEMQLKAVRHGLRVQEIALPYRCRTRGTSKISGNLRGAVRAGIRIVYAVYRYR